MARSPLSRTANKPPEYIPIGSIQIDLTVTPADTDNGHPGDGVGDGVTTKVMRAIEKGIKDSGMVPHGTGVWITRAAGPNTLHCGIFRKKPGRRKS